MTQVHCEDCVHFLTAPYQAPHTGCWHPDNMRVKQKEAYLNQQQLPGDNEKLNLRHDCPKYEARAKPQSIWQRLFGRAAG